MLSELEARSLARSSLVHSQRHGRDDDEEGQAERREGKAWLAESIADRPFVPRQW